MDHNNSMLNRYLFSHRELSYSVPQGSILGPIFFLYIHDLPRCYVQGVKMVLHANDTIILVEVKDEYAHKLKTESVMKQLEVWFLNNELILYVQNLCEVFSL